MDGALIARIGRLRRLRSVSEGYLDSLLAEERARLAAVRAETLRELQNCWQPKYLVGSNEKGAAEATP